MTKKVALFNTNKGIFKIELFNDKAPITVGNFIKLVNDRFYPNRAEAIRIAIRDLIHDEVTDEKKGE